MFYQKNIAHATKVILLSTIRCSHMLSFAETCNKKLFHNPAKMITVISSSTSRTGKSKNLVTKTNAKKKQNAVSMNKTSL